MTKNDWQTVPLKKGLLAEINMLLQLKTVRDEEGISNVSRFVDQAVREKMERLERKRFELINMHDDHVKVLDSKLEKMGRIVSVYFREGGRAWCDYCEEHLCVHIQYAWEVPDVRKILDRNGATPPPSRTAYG